SRLLLHQRRLRQMQLFQTHFAFDHTTVPYLHRSSVVLAGEPHLQVFLCRYALQVRRQSCQSRVSLGLRAMTTPNRIQVGWNFQTNCWLETSFVRLSRLFGWKLQENWWREAVDRFI